MESTIASNPFGRTDASARTKADFQSQKNRFSCAVAKKE